MRLSNSLAKLKNDWMPPAAGRKGPDGSFPFVTVVSLYEGDTCIRQESFAQPCVAIGHGQSADFVLKGSSIAPIHAYVYVESDQLFIFGTPSENPFSINNRTVKAAQLAPQDSVEVGPYRLRFEIRPSQVPATDKHDPAAAKKNGAKRNGGKNGSKKSNFDLKNLFQDRVSRPAGRQGKDDNRAAALEAETIGHSDADDQGDIPFQIIFKGEFKKGHKPLRVIKQLKETFHLQAQQTAVLLSGKRITIKKGLSLAEAGKFKAAFEKTGAVCDVEAMLDGDDTIKPPAGMTGKSETIKASASVDPVPPKSRPVPQIKTPAALDDRDDEDEDDDSPASFSLKEKLCMFSGFDRQLRRQMPVPFKNIGIFKFKKDSVIDVKFITAKGNFYIQLDRRRFRLAQKNRAGKNFFYFDDRFAGIIRDQKTGVVPLSKLQVKENLYRKRKGIYRIGLPDAGEIVVSDGCYDYLIRGMVPSRSPLVPEPEKKKKIDWKYLGYSLGAHVTALVVLAVASLFSDGTARAPEPRFVTVDQNQVARIMKKPKPTVKPRPQKPVKAKPVRKKTVVKQKAVKPSPKRKVKPAPRVAAKSSSKGRAKAPSRHPKAGGGAGKGNVRNRNIKQVGILSMLGDTSGAKSKKTVAAITNLDAVKSNSSGGAKFKVGGIKGKLGNSSISVPTSEVVATKGNTQVLRSAGAGGKGSVAALEKGSVGQGKVMGMVKARLNKSVKIQGGMSREAVKRVIEQHLDEVTYCYESALISSPSIKGRIIYEWKIRMSGTVGEVRIKSSSVNSNGLHACIKSRIKTWQFPKPVGNEVVVSYPFVFDIVGF